MDRDGCILFASIGTILGAVILGMALMDIKLALLVFSCVVGLAGSIAFIVGVAAFWTWVFEEDEK